jgi:creatinine amidohydrolase
MPSKYPWRLSEATLKDVRKHKYNVAVLPFGATEPHNLHLPYATDNIEVSEVCERACAYAWKKGARVALLPTMPYGCDQNMLGFPMAMSVDQELLNSLIESIAKSLECHGVEKLVVVNGHGGNQFQSGLRTLYARTSIFITLVNWYEAASADGGGNVFEHKGQHADEMETSMIQALAPHLVDLPSADDGATLESRFEAGRKGWAWYARPWEKLTTNSGVGYPHKATAEKGFKYLALAEERMGEFFYELAKTPRDKYFPFKSPTQQKKKKSPPKKK